MQQGVNLASFGTGQVVVASRHDHSPLLIQRLFATIWPAAIRSSIPHSHNTTGVSLHTGTGDKINSLMQGTKKTNPNAIALTGTAYGVDGCKAGWFCIALDPSRTIRWHVVQTLDELVAKANNGDRIFVDIPIGLSDGPEERLCDKEARRWLGPPRASSVFRTPVRAALDAGDDVEAKRINLAVASKSLSAQTLAIMPKIREVDALLRGCMKAHGMVREVHPEVCFWSLAGERPMMHRKKTREGSDERIAVLKSVRPSIDQELAQICTAVPRRNLEKDDILDAMAAALTALANPGELRTLPERPPRDAYGLPMEMVYYSKATPTN